jgi:nitroimidazol reductase NimA-like FMN-containing flavoprotein (pyridoxamine 5'-phosphate oxidase superfamily)
MSTPSPASSVDVTVRRHPERGCYDRQAIDAILDEALVCHVAFVADGHPVVIPTLGVRLASTYYFHGSSLSRMLTALADGLDVSVAVTLIDGLVLARSAFNHSVNYRSVVLFGRAREVSDEREKWQALEALVDHVVAGRWTDVRPPTTQEMNATRVVGVPIDRASAKIRRGPPKDLESDYARSVWAGVIPLGLAAGPPEPDPRLAPGIVPPRAVAAYRRPQSRG